MEYYAVQQLGEKRALTPEGFLLCLDVPVARIGDMVYGPNETPIPTGDDGRVVITRTPDEVFATKSLASLVGKPVTDDHPPVDVVPENWKFYLKGVVMNPHQGTGDQTDLLVADLIIYDPEIISEVNDGKREISCGYNPEYFPVVDDAGNMIPGRGAQKNIVYNHVALVDKGRCGSRCAIGDRATMDSNRRSSPMSTFTDKLRAAFKARDEKALDALIGSDDPDADKGGSNGGGAAPTHVEVHTHVPVAGQPDGPNKTEGSDAAPPWFKDFKKEQDARYDALRDSLDGRSSRDRRGRDRRGRDGLRDRRSRDDEFGGDPDGGDDDDLNDRLDRIETAMQAFLEWARGTDAAIADARRSRDEAAISTLGGTRGEIPDNAKPETKTSGDAASKDGEKEDKDKDGAKDGRTGDAFLLENLAAEAPNGEEERAQRATDSSFLRDSFTDTLAKAEILSPGIRLPSFDRAASPKATFDTICSLRRDSLDLAYNKAETRDMIRSALNGKDLDVKAMRCNDVRTLFNAVASSAAEANRARAIASAPSFGGAPVAARARSLADINKRNQEFFSKR